MREATSHSGQTSRIELLYFEGCPGFTETLETLRKVITEEGFAAEILPVPLDPGSRSGFPGSPTVLLDGEDLFPQERPETRTYSCRIYFTPEGPKNYPTATMVREALEKRSTEKRPSGSAW